MMAMFMMPPRTTPPRATAMSPATADNQPHEDHRQQEKEANPEEDGKDAHDAQCAPAEETAVSIIIRCNGRNGRFRAFFT